MESIVRTISVTAAFIAILAGIVTITWFIRDTRKENSKVLKRQEAILENHTKILVKIEEGQRMGLVKIEEGQRIGFETLARILANQIKILVKIEEGQRKGFETLARILENQTKILAKIEAKD